MNSFNQWAEGVRVSSRYVAPKDTPQGYYFNTQVFKQSLQTKTKTSIMKMLKRLLGIAVIAGAMSSCHTAYTGISNGKGCGVWYPKKYKGSAPKPRGNAHMVSF